MPDDANCRFLTAQEIEQRIYALNRAAALRLQRSAAIYASGTDWSAGDLVQEAFVAALERRKWRADLETVVFLTGIMRSLAHSRRKTQRIAPLDLALAAGDDQREGFEAISAGDEHNPAEIAAAEQALEQFVERLESCFKDDHEVLEIIRGRAAGESPAVIRAALGMNQSAFETVCRRLLRGYQAQIKLEQT